MESEQKEEHMADHVGPTPTPNIVIENPDVRRKITFALGIIGGILGIAVTADAASLDFDIARYTIPALAVYAYITSLFGLGVTAPNTPKL